MAARARLTEMGLALPSAAAPVANYMPFSKMGNLIFMSGAIPKIDGELKYTGLCGKDVTVEAAQDAAKMCMLNLLAQMEVACEGNLDRVKKVHKLGVFVACGHDFTQQPVVANGASDLLVAVLGENGRHARSAVGVPALPLGVPVEIDAIIEIE
eukprot:PhM_4_TR535/c0_g1_i1/m.89021